MTTLGRRYSQKPPRGTAPDLGHPLNRGLVGWWPFLEGGGNMLRDYSGFGHHGTLTNMDPPNDWILRNDRLPGYTLDMDGSNDYVSCGAITQLSGLQRASFAGWIYRAASGTRAGFGAYLVNSRFAILWDTDNNVYFTTENGSTKYTFFAQNTTGWHHVTLIFDGTATGTAKHTVYWNGVARTLSNDGNAPNNTTLPATQVDFRIGMDNGGTDRFFPGRYDDIRVYNRPLTQQEALELYRNPWQVFSQKQSRYAFSSGAAPAPRTTDFFPFFA